jgi:hypothetical protein
MEVPIYRREKDNKVVQPNFEVFVEFENEQPTGRSFKTLEEWLNE